jgi:DNA sulfur modification protein DndD
MIINQLTLQNFGIYAGRQTVDLRPPSPEQPVVLFGGLNGGGKTTFLDAIQLALYGKFAECSNRGNLGYSEFLKRCINHSAIDEHAEIELEFTHTTSGVDENYKLVRRWKDRAGKIEETFLVRVDDEISDYLSAHWTESVERILPRRIANLFLFDGEKIESYASPETARELIKSAVHSLLGIDVVEQLERDLGVLSQRKIKGSGDTVLTKIIETLEKEYSELQRTRRGKKSEIADFRSKLDRLEKRSENNDQEFEQKGGKLFERRGELETQHAEIVEGIAEIETSMREFAAGDAPLMLIRPLIESVLSQAQREYDSTQNSSFVALLDDRDQELVDAVTEMDASGDLINKLIRHLSDDRAERRQASETDYYLEMGHASIKESEHLLKTGLPNLCTDGEALLSQRGELVAERDRLSAELSQVPDEASIQAIVRERQNIQDEKTGIQNEIVALEDDCAALDLRLERVGGQLRNKLETKITSEVESEDDLRVIEHAGRVSKTLETFRTVAVSKHLYRIEELILESFNELHRKMRLISEVKIDPTTFDLKVYTETGKELLPERLSAGERQLLAVATLWGLAKASNRKLPTIIDTPLGRLDSKHRSKIVERYFPHASHQVILLSTDEEIVGKYLEALAPSVGNSYELVFDEALGTTSISDGYFEQEVSHAH